MKKMRDKIALWIVATALMSVFLISIVPGGSLQVSAAALSRYSIANSSPALKSSSINYSYPEQICALPRGNISANIFYSRTPDIKTTDPGVFLVDQNNGNLYWCSILNTNEPGNVTLIAKPPPGATGGGYYGLGGRETGPKVKGVVLVLTSHNLHGMWFCYFATYQTCARGESSFVQFPSSYCSTLATKTCDPYGTALDSALNVYWVDRDNAVFSECTAASNYSDCFTLPYSSALRGYKPMGLALIRGMPPYFGHGWSFYITDNTCAGIIWWGNGTASSHLRVYARINDSLQGIGTTTNDVGYNEQLLVGDSGRCLRQPAQVLDISNSSQIVRTTFTAPTPIIGISVCWGQCLQNKPASRQLFYTGSDNGTVFVSNATMG